jgi:riboflavin synthase
MFTGIVEELGTIAAAGARMNIKCRIVLADTREGSSISVNGVCLTATSVDASGFWCDLSPETLARTNLGALHEGSRVNLERPAAVGDRLSGHIVQGHVDGTGEFISLDPLPDGNWWLKVRVPKELDRYMIHKGSITLDGVSLTIAALEDSVVGVAIIPFTYGNTVISSYVDGTRINVEVDLIGKYVEKFLVSRFSFLVGGGRGSFGDNG